MLLDLFCVFAQGLFIARNYDDVLISAEASGSLFTGTITMAKFLTFCFRNDQIFEIMEEIASLTDKFAKSELIKAAAKLDKRISTVYLIATIGTGLGYCAVPLISNFVRVFIYGTGFIPQMPFKSAFFYDVSMSPAYEVTFFIYCLATYAVIFISVSQVNS